MGLGRVRLGKHLMLKFFLPATVAQPGPRWEVPRCTTNIMLVEKPR